MATNFESIKLNFKSSAYSTAVTQLESKMKELESARSEYDQRRSEIPQFWDGDARDEAYEVIGQNIENVKTAYKAVEENMKAFKEADKQHCKRDQAEAGRRPQESAESVPVLMEFYLNPERLEQRNENVREQLRHVRRFSELVRQSKKIDTMHQKELIRIQQRLDRMERNLSQLITATDELQQEMKDDMAQLRHDATQLFT